MIEPIYKGKSMSFWLEMLRDQSERYRRDAVAALRVIGMPAIPGLIQMFKAGHTSERTWAIRTLGQIGPKAEVALPVVRLALKDRSADVREAAAETLRLIEPGAGVRFARVWSRLRELLPWRRTAVNGRGDGRVRV